MRVLVPMMDGFEEIEAITAISVLRNANITVTTAGIPGTMVKSSKSMKFMTDARFDDIKPEEFDAIVLVGGNADYMGNSKKITKAISDLNSKGKVIAAINNAPSILARMGVIENKKATIYPGLERELPRPRGERVVVDGNIITSQGPGTAMEFALKLVEVLQGSSESKRLRQKLVS